VKPQVKKQLDADQIGSTLIKQKPRLIALDSKSFFSALISVPLMLL
jgi:hypothetical protein